MVNYKYDPVWGTPCDLPEPQESPGMLPTPQHLVPELPPEVTCCLLPWGFSPFSTTLQEAGCDNTWGQTANKNDCCYCYSLGGRLFGVGELVRCLASNLSFPETAAKPEVTDTALKCQRERRLPHWEEQTLGDLPGPHVKPNTTSDTGTLFLFENKRQNVPPCLMGPEGGGECKFQYELITLSQPASKARVCKVSLRTSLGNVSTWFHTQADLGGEGGVLNSGWRWHSPVTLVIPRMLTVSANYAFVTVVSRNGCWGQ